jgi:hypothetical protein
MPHRLGGQIGLERAGLWGRVPVTVLLEATKVLRYTYATFYGLNYTHAGHPLGYADGPDTEHYLLRARIDPSLVWSWEAAVDVIRSGPGFLGEFWDPEDARKPWSTFTLEGPVETTVTATLSAGWFPRDTIRLRLTGGLFRVRNRGNERAGWATEGLARVEGVWRF